MIHFVGHQKSQHAKKMFYDFSMTQHSCHTSGISSLFPTHNVVFNFDKKDATLKNQYSVQSVCLPSCNDMGLQFLFFANLGELRSNLINQTPRKSLICSDSHQDKPTQFSVN